MALRRRGRAAGRAARPVDLALIDLWKDLYIPCVERLLPILAPTGVIVADNMLFPEMARADAAAYRARIRAEPGMEAVLLPIGQGINIASRSFTQPIEP